VSRRPEGWEGFCARVAELHDLLTALGVRYLFLKTVKSYPHTDSNVDVLIPHRAEFLRVRRALQEKGFRPVFTWEFDKAMLQPPSGRPSPSDPAAHLYACISWYTVPYLDAHRVLARARILPWNGLALPVPDLQDEFYIGALHAFFEEEALTWGDVWHLQSVQEALRRRRASEPTDLSPAARWAVQAVARALEELKGLQPASVRGPQSTRTRGREREVAYPFPKRVLWRGFALRMGEALQRGRPGDLLRTLYAYGGLHVAKRLKLLRG